MLNRLLALSLAFVALFLSMNEMAPLFDGCSMPDGDVGVFGAVALLLIVRY